MKDDQCLDYSFPLQFCDLRNLLRVIPVASGLSSTVHCTQYHNSNEIWENRKLINSGKKNYTLTFAGRQIFFPGLVRSLQLVGKRVSVRGQSLDLNWV